MARPKDKTRRNQIRPLGVAERIGDAPPSHYTYGGHGGPDDADTYTLDGTAHRFDGKCHETCENVR